MENTIIIGVDIGGTSIRAGCVVNKKIEKKYSQPTGSSRSAEQILETLYKVIENVWLPGTLAIGVGVPGLLNAEKGEILNISNIPTWKNLALKKKLEAQFKIPVYVNNDANCFALGEKHFGKGQKYRNMVAITLGTGVGGGTIINDKIHTGMFGGAGEVGCWPYKGENFEAYCGSNFFIKKNSITGIELFEKAMSGDQQALTIFDEFGKHLGMMMKNIFYILAPEAIIIGGAISKSFSFFEAGIRKELSDFSFKVITDNIAIEQSELDDVALLGAAGLYYNSNSTN